jgi:hypothetical protein
VKRYESVQEKLRALAVTSGDIKNLAECIVERALRYPISERDYGSSG